MKIAGFDWDDGNRHKCRKHGVTIQEIEAVLQSDPPLSRDVGHSDSEDRFIAVDRTPAGRAVLSFLPFDYMRANSLSGR